MSKNVVEIGAILELSFGQKAWAIVHAAHSFSVSSTVKQFISIVLQVT